jgi:hypothetical protein
VSSLLLLRREFLKGLLGFVAAPTLVKIENLMPVAPWRPEFRVSGGMHGWPIMLMCERADLDGFNVTSLGLPSPPPLWPPQPCRVNGGKTAVWRYENYPLSRLPFRQMRLHRTAQGVLASELAGEPMYRINPA